MDRYRQIVMPNLKTKRRKLDFTKVNAFFKSNVVTGKGEGDD